MSFGEDNFDRRVAKELDRLSRQMGRSAGRDVPAIYLNWVQRSLNPIALGSSGVVAFESGMPFPTRPLAFYCSVFVATTNNATNFWTLDLIDSNSVVLATISTAAIGANSWTRLEDLTVTAPSSSMTGLFIRPTATLSPGSIYMLPNVALLRT